ncbi:MAG: HAMP domain-containing protein [Oscillospiraceae bacterium]|nr:HAMP domain-containing protein [Oscillospiraceae bacterium]
MAAQTTTPQEPAAVQSSISMRLNARLFLRMLGIFLGIDLLVCLLSLGCMAVWAESRAAGIAQLVTDRGIPTEEAAVWAQTGGYEVYALEREPQGWGGTVNLGAKWPEDAGTSLRSFQFDMSLLGPVHEARYIVELSGGGAPYAIALDISGPASIWLFALRILLLCELAALIIGIFQNAGLVKKSLRPLQDLATAASKLSSAAHDMSPEELRRLTGALDQINATHLDARIQVSGSQREVQSLAAAINAMLDRINEAYSSQMRFVSDASHELRTPIAVIQGYANLLDRWGKDDPDTRQEAIDAIRAEADSMKALIEQLLFLARGDNDAVHFEEKPLNLSALATEVVRESDMIDDVHTFELTAPEPVWVSGDEGLLKQCLRILTDNSLKYSPDGGKVTLTVASGGGNARISVQDEGQGIPEESLSHVFERFYRTDESRTRQTGGTGLGLAIAKWIAERHKGHFELLSRVGLGTRFTLVLPLIPSPKEENAE